jgi:hypothetical protein
MSTATADSAQLPAWWSTRDASGRGVAVFWLPVHAMGRSGRRGSLGAQIGQEALFGFWLIADRCRRT